MKNQKDLSKPTALTEADQKAVLDDVKPIVGDGPHNTDTNVGGNNEVGTGSNEFKPTKIIGKGSVVKQEAIAKAISGNGAGGSSGVTPTIMNSNLRSIPYSGTDARIIDNASGTPAFNKSDRRDSRYGQKTDNTARKINYVPSETYELEYDGPKPLSESPDAVQGSLGHPDNKYARIQKASEAFPGAINFERSIDEGTDDLILATNGQQSSYLYDDSYNNIDPTKTYSPKQRKLIDYHLHRGNYVPRTAHVKYDDSGKLTEFYYDEDSFECRITGDLVAERSNTHTITAANRAEVDRQAMAAKAGNEVKEEWSPIPFAYPEPTRDVLYLSTVEKQLGANVLMAVKMSAKAHSYQLNKATKDGMRPESAGVEIGLGCVWSKNNSKAYDQFTFGRDTDNNSIFNRRFTSRGAPSGIIAMMDSIAKYHDRSDILTQPRSFNMILKQGISGYKAFKIDPEFARVFDNTNVFSTIDRPYDPSLMVNIQDSYGLMNAYSLNELGSCFRTGYAYVGLESNFDNDCADAIYNEEDITFDQDEDPGNTFHLVGTIKRKLSGSDSISSYSLTSADYAEVYEMLRRDAAGMFGHEFLHHKYVVAFMKENASNPNKAAEDVAKLVFIDCDGLTFTTGDYRKFTIHYGSSTDKVTLNDFDAAASEVVDLVYNNYLASYYHNRQNYYYLELRDPYTDGIKIFLRQNYGLMSKVILNGSIEYPIHYSTKSFNAYSYIVMLAMRYMQEARAKSMLDVLNYSNIFGYPFTDCDDCSSYAVLGGSQYGQSDIFELLEVRQMSPATALRWVYPELYCNLTPKDGSTNGYRTMMPFYMNEDNFEIAANGKISLTHDRAAMSYPVTKSGIRWSFSDLIYGFSERDVRLILDMMVTPPTFRGRDSFTVNDDEPIEVYKYSQASDGLIVIPNEGITIADHLSTPRELGYMFPVKGGYLFPEPDNSDNYTTRYKANAIITGHSSHRVVCWFNDSATPATDILQTGSSIITRASNFTQQYRIFNVYEENAGLELGICLGTGSITNVTDGATLFIPFTDGIIEDGSEAVDVNSPALYSYSKAMWARIQKMPFAFNPFDFGGAVVYTDPLSFNYLLGLVGFRSSDYKEDLYNRLTKRMAEGWTFVSDPFVEDSLMVK